jgi:hypothetical protein
VKLLQKTEESQEFQLQITNFSLDDITSILSSRWSQRPIADCQPIFEAMYRMKNKQMRGIRADTAEK